MRERLPRGALSRDAIILAALGLLERGGTPALTIRGVAHELGSDPTALYRHFRSKSEMLGAIGDRLLADVSGPREGATWRDALEQVASDLRDVLSRHPGGVGLFAESDYTPAAARLVERTVAHLIATGLPASLAGSAVRATVTLAFGNAVQTTEYQFWPALLLLARPPLAFPAIHADAAGWTAGPETHFEHQLALLLDGIGAQL